MATRAAQLYDKNFHAWTRAQAPALRRLADQRWNGPLDLLHMAEEIEGVGSEQQWAVERQLERIIEHLLKLEYSPSADPRCQWMISVIAARGEIERRMSATIQREVEPGLPDRYRRSRRKAELALLDHGDAAAAHDLPPACPYDFADLLAHEWWPANRPGLTDQG
jgi:DNA-binding PucR family transcriptional regulator